MMYDSDDELDKALFALALEEPPADLRASILTATVYRPAPAFSVMEVTILGALVAVLVWLVVYIAVGGGALFGATISAIEGTLSHSLSNVTTLSWLAAGGATAFWLMFFTGSQPFSFVSQRLGRKTSR